MGLFLPTRILLLSVCACALLSADQVVLKNGDTITGSVVKKDGAKLIFKSEFLGEVSIPWTAIKTLKSDQELVVILPNNESVKGKLTTNGDNIEVATAGGETTTPLATVGEVRSEAEQHAWERLQKPRILELWVGNYDMGLAVARGNARTLAFTNNFTAARVSAKGNFVANFNEIYATALVNGVNAATASALHFNWTYNRTITPKFFLSGNNGYDHDRFQDLELRAVFGGGAGWYAVKNERTSLTFQGGGDYEHESFDNFSRNSAEAVFGDNFVYKLAAGTSLTQDLRFFPNLTYTGQYRMNFNLSAVTAVKKWLGWHLTFSDTYLSDPVLGRLRNDVILSTGVRVTFATK
jgi:putative salt-induced outer membrane protein YdiY